MEEVQQAIQPDKKLLSKEERSRVMREAATRRWAKAKREAAAAKAAHSKPAKAPKAIAKAAPGRKRPAAPREFSSALKTAEKRLAKAIQERAEAANKYAMVNAEIPSLQQIILALKNPFGALPSPYPQYQISGPVMPPTLEQIVGDQPLAYQNPPRRMDIPAQPEMPLVPVPQRLHPANTQGLAGGGAIGGVDLASEEDEDQFLRESGVAGGNWHG